MFLQKQIFMVSDECTLLKQFKSGEREAFDRLFKMYAPQLGYFCLRLVRQEDAEEIVQETFIKLWETRDKIKVELNFNTYITTIAKNLIYDMFRKKLVEQRYYQKFQSLIQEQLEQQREVMMLKCKGFNNDEIAELLGISKRTVEAHLNKAYKKLRQDLGEVRYYLLFFTFLLN